MTEQEAYEGLNREQRRRLQKMIKSGLTPLQARESVLSDLRQPSEGNLTKRSINANKTASVQKRFIRKSNG